MATNTVAGLPSAKLPMYAKYVGDDDNDLVSYLNNRLPSSSGSKWTGDLGLNGQSFPTADYSAPAGSTSTTATTPQSGIDWSKVGSTAVSNVGNLVPFASNIVNSFRKPPMPVAPGMLSGVTLNRVNNSNERAEIDRQVQGDNGWADRNLDGNSAAAYRAANLSGKLRAYSGSYQGENNQNVQIGNQQNLYNAGIDQQNVRARDGYNQQLIERQIAQQRTQSANLSNAADKYVGLKNASAQRKLDQDKWTELSRLYDGSIGDRYNQWLKAHGVDDGLEKKAMGGAIPSNRPASFRKMRRAF